MTNKDRLRTTALNRTRNVARTSDIYSSSFISEFVQHCVFGFNASGSQAIPWFVNAPYFDAAATTDGAVQDARPLSQQRQ